ncbi:MAG: type II secretion system F family protein [Candidatus Micrarchaeia archaeon]
MMFWKKKKETLDEILKKLEKKTEEVKPQPQQATQPMQTTQATQTTQTPQPKTQGVVTPQIIQQKPKAMEEKKIKVKPKTLVQRWKTFVEYFASKRKDLPELLKAAEIRESPYEFTQRVLITSLLITILICGSLIILFLAIGVNPIIFVLIAPILFIFFVNYLMLYPLQKIRISGKEVEKDVLFAVRDMIIALRGGVPLYNAIVSVSRGYGAASQEFSKIINLVNLGVPLDQAIDQVVTTSKSPSFRRVMLQASTTLKAGADITAAMELTLEQITNERVIELRRYGQKLNAVAMFYMIVGVIFPSMLITVAIVLSTFINIITFTPQLLMIAFIFILLLQLVFLNIIKNMRPSYA